MSIPPTKVETSTSTITKPKTIIRSKEALNFTNPTELTLSSQTKEIINCSMCPLCECPEHDKEQIEHNVFIPNYDTSFSNIQTTCDRRGGIVKFALSSSDETMNGELDSARYMDYINQKATLIQQKWKQYIYSKKVRINMYRGGIVSLFKRSKSANHIHNVNEHKHYNCLCENALIQKMKQIKLIKCKPLIITKTNISNYEEYQQKNIAANFKCRACKQLRFNKNNKLRYEIADLWIEDTVPSKTNEMYIQKQQRNYTITSCNNKNTFSYISPMRYSEGTNTTPWTETNKLTSHNLTITIEAMKKIIEQGEQISFTIQNDQLCWNRKINVDNEHKNEIMFDKIDKSKYYEITNKPQEMLSIKRYYERRIWNKMISMNRCDRFELINKRDNVFYQINAIDNKDYSIHIGNNPKDIMYTLTKRDIMFIWNKANKVDSQDMKVFDCYHNNNTLTFRSNEEERNDIHTHNKISHNDSINNMVEDISYQDNDNNNRIEIDIGGTQCNNLLDGYQVCSIEVENKINTHTNTNYISLADNFSYNNHNNNNNNYNDIESLNNKDDNLNVDVNINSINYMLITNITKDKWNKENECIEGAESITIINDNNNNAHSNSNPIEFKNSFGKDIYYNYYTYVPEIAEVWNDKNTQVYENEIQYNVYDIDNNNNNNNIEIDIGIPTEMHNESFGNEIDNNINSITTTTVLKSRKTNPKSKSSLIDEQTQTVQTNHNPNPSSNINNVGVCSNYKGNNINSPSYATCGSKLNTAKLNSSNHSLTNQSKTNNKLNNKVMPLIYSSGISPYEVNVIQNDEYIQNIKLKLMKSVNNNNMNNNHNNNNGTVSTSSTVKSAKSKSKGKVKVKASQPKNTTTQYSSNSPFYRDIQKGSGCNHNHNNNTNKGNQNINVTNTNINYVQYSVGPNNKGLNKVKAGGINIYTKDNGVEKVDTQLIEEGE